MNKSTIAKKTPNPNRVVAQLKRRQAERAAKLALEAAVQPQPEPVPAPVVPEPQPEPAPAAPSADFPVRRALGKIKRAHRKGGKPDATEAELQAFLDALLAAGVPVMHRTSSRMAKVVKGERTIESLLLERGAKNAVA